MQVGRSWRTAAAVSLAALALLPACNRRKPAEVNDIVPKFEVNRSRAPLGSAIEVTYTWQLEPTAKKLTQDHRAFVHFLDSHKVLLFDDDHVPVPPVTGWEPGKSYSYTRTKFIPIYPYVGDVDVRVGLQPSAGRGERVALKGTDAGLHEYSVAKMELLPQTENIFLVYKEGWHNPESSAQNPSLERTWTKKDALVSFKNPKKDIIVYLEADTNSKAFDAPPVLTVAVGGKAGLVVPIDNSEVFLKKIRVKAADLGDQEWVDLRLSMNQSFVPKAKGVNPTDDRELGLMVYHLYVGEADKLGNVPNVVDATPVTLAPMGTPSPAPGASPAPGTKGSPGAKAAPGAKTSPAAKAASPAAKAAPKKP
ncbi:MAG TPA: hypothetical protein VGQ33_06450 [Vicinamibacteria bacterium]|nr:hypothetical protein [Vicinamibacteria bacterium]